MPKKSGLVRRSLSEVQALGCELSRHFVADAFIRSGNQRRFHVRP